MRPRHLAVVALSLVLGACTLKEDPLKAPPDVAAAPADAHRTPSGLASKIIRVGFGSARPAANSTVQVHYAGWTPDGQNFDSSYSRGEPTQFRLTEVIDGWTEGLQLMTVGEKRRFWIPGDLAYDNVNMPGAPKGPLVFDIELLNVR
jgi:FKBP-type peptidyl-prolyl cis-trans isomerase